MHDIIKLSLLAALAGSLGLPIACSGDEQAAAGSCVPGQSRACSGMNTCAGFEVCRPDGQGFEPCSCGSGTGGGGTGDCASALQCSGSELCDPHTGECVASLACTTHEDCGGAAYCEPGGSCAENVEGGLCEIDDNCLPPEICTGGVCGCGGEFYGAESVPPNVLIVLDRSSSMNDEIGGGTKWEIAQQAIAEMLANYGGSIYFGLMLYPGTNQSGSEGQDCGPGAVFVDPGPDTSDGITTFLGGAGTTGFGTPTAEALDILPTYAGLEDTTRSNYVMLITDGQSTCNDPVPSVTALRGEAPEIRTFVIGFGSAVDPDELNDMAEAGGTAQPEMPYYYQADDAASLADAFSSIAGTVFSCAYVLSEIPPDPDQLYVYLDGDEVPQSADDGWSYDAGNNELNFNGPTCDALRAGTASELVISYGCPVPDIR